MKTRRAAGWEGRKRRGECKSAVRSQSSDSPVGTVVKNPPANAGDWFDP